MADFLVIGGGIAGISAAARLSHLGSVVLLEAETALGYHASGRSAAMFEQTYGSPTTRALNRASKAYHETVDGGVLSPRGLMLIGTADSRDAFARDLALMAMRPIPVAEAVRMVPVLDPAVVTDTGYHAEAWDIDTDRLIQAFAREARAHGGQVLTGHEVQAIRRAGSDWVAETARGAFAAPILVNAAGAWVDRIAEMAGVPPLGFRPCRRSMARIPAPGGHDVRGWPMIYGAGESWYAKPDAGRLLVSPADETPVAPHDAWPEDLTLAEGLARFEAVTTEPVHRLLSSWAGLRTFAPDRSLVIGPDPRRPDFVWFAGQGGYGFQTAPAASQLLADILAGRPGELDADTRAGLTPERFFR